ncbi:MAG: hypothetical protein EA355_12145 [Rhodobacteraceae bacterium]|nr:MAG: hypothetical protein EA355_12145 [Paracoccaceae bacterium]
MEPEFAAGGVRTATGAFFIIASAGCYVASMVAMKLWDGLPALPAAAFIAAALFGAVVFEIFALRLDRLGFVYAAILGAEVVMLGFVSHWGLGERFTARELAGIGMITAGAAVAWT